MVAALDVGDPGRGPPGSELQQASVALPPSFVEGELDPHAGFVDSLGISHEYLRQTSRRHGRPGGVARLPGVEERLLVGRLGLVVLAVSFEELGKHHQERSLEGGLVGPLERRADLTGQLTIPRELLGEP